MKLNRRKMKGTDEMIVETTKGKIEGVYENGMIAFKGIPYAKPPVGKLRFKAPVPVDNWNDTINANHFGPRCLQTKEQEYKDNLEYSEDCLNLNIWTPTTGGEKKPVIFYIHGGGHISGANSDEFFDGQHLIRDKEAVMVAPNYRLGAWGYLYLGELLGEEYEDSGNCGLLDQLIALKWVNENISAFGGDPHMVILMGQSAGAKSVANLMVTPNAKGLFHRAILQSGATQCIRDRHTATKLALYTLEALGLTEITAREILNKSGEEILKAQELAYHKVNTGHLFGPVLDGKTIKESPEEYIQSGKMGNLPVLIGFNKEELFFSNPDINKYEEEVKEILQKTYGLNWAFVYEKYVKYCSKIPSPIAFDQIQTDCVYGNATSALTQLLSANGAMVWSYRWDYGGNGKASHFSEMPYIFGYTMEESMKGYDKKDQALAELMNETWMAFIMTGNPENQYLRKWYPCTMSEMGYRMHLDKVCHLEQINLHSYMEGFPMQVIKL